MTHQRQSPFISSLQALWLHFCPERLQTCLQKRGYFQAVRLQLRPVSRDRLRPNVILTHQRQSPFISSLQALWLHLCPERLHTCLQKRGHFQAFRLQLHPVSEDRLRRNVVLTHQGQSLFISSLRVLQLHLCSERLHTCLQKRGHFQVFRLQLRIWQKPLLPMDLISALCKQSVSHIGGRRKRLKDVRTASAVVKAQ